MRALHYKPCRVINHVQITWIRGSRKQHQSQWRARHAAVRDFRNLSEIHNDGWGSALVTVPSESPYLRDGGAPTPETGTAVYKNTIAARHDPIFDELANTPARGGLWHLRLASSNLPLILENQQRSTPTD